MVFERRVLLCRVIRFSPFANRLAYDGIPKKIQKLRCFTNFIALRFAHPIADMANTVVERMKAKSASTNGNYVSIHLRFEEVSADLPLLGFQRWIEPIDSNGGC